MGNKFYAIKSGKKTGIFTTWNECKELVIGYPGSEYRSFNNRIDAEVYLKDDGQGPDNISEVGGINLNDNLKGIGQNKTHSLRLSKEWIYKLIDYMKTLENVSFNHTEHDRPKHDSYKFISSSDKITFNVYETGKFVIQGKPTYLYGEAISFLSYCPEITIDDIVEANNKLQEVNLKISDIRDEMENIMPNSYKNIDETIFKMLSPSLTLKKLKLDLEDYSCYAFPALRALEGYLKYLLDLKGIEVDYKFGTIFVYNQKKGQYYLKRKLAIAMNDTKMEQSLEKVYNYFHENRHTIFHANQILIQSRILEEKEEANLIINEVINIIEDTYNDIVS